MATAQPAPSNHGDVNTAEAKNVDANGARLPVFPPDICANAIMDNVTAMESTIIDAAQVAKAIDEISTNVRWAIHTSDCSTATYRFTGINRAGKVYIIRQLMDLFPTRIYVRLRLGLLKLTDTPTDLLMSDARAIYIDLAPVAGHNPQIPGHVEALHQGL